MAIRTQKSSTIRKHLTIIIAASLFASGWSLSKAFHTGPWQISLVGDFLFLAGFIGLIVGLVQEGVRWKRKPHYYSPSKPRIQRPKGVTALGILYVLGGLISFDGFRLLLQGTWGTSPTLFMARQMELAYFGQLLPSNLEYTFGVALVALGATLIIIGYGALKGRSWGWKPLIISNIISIPISIYQIKDLTISGLIVTIFSLVLYLLIFYYLYRPHVKQYFGKIANPSFHEGRSAV